MLHIIAELCDEQLRDGLHEIALAYPEYCRFESDNAIYGDDLRSEMREMRDGIDMDIYERVIRVVCQRVIDIESGGHSMKVTTDDDGIIVNISYSRTVGAFRCIGLLLAAVSSPPDDRDRESNRSEDEPNEESNADDFSISGSGSYQNDNGDAYSSEHTKKKADIQDFFTPGFEYREVCLMDTVGVMIDCSRNAILQLQSVLEWMRMCALCGVSMMMLYTEDTYQMSGHPFFGYLRGGYTHDELAQIEEYAAYFGIEIIPCMQTLGHLGQVLQWPRYSRVRDTDTVLLVDDKDAYSLVENMIGTAASTLGRSRRIHCGMDEAWGLGSGVYLERARAQQRQEQRQKAREELKRKEEQDSQISTTGIDIDIGIGLGIGSADPISLGISQSGGEASQSGSVDVDVDASGSQEPSMVDEGQTSSGSGSNGLGDDHPMSIFMRHLERVAGSCREIDREPLVWSDMVFRLDGEGVIRDSQKGLPSNISLVYWDYYRTNASEYASMIDRHIALLERNNTKNNNNSNSNSDNGGSIDDGISISISDESGGGSGGGGSGGSEGDGHVLNSATAIDEGEDEGASRDGDGDGVTVTDDLVSVEVDSERADGTRTRSQPNGHSGHDVMDRLWVACGIWTWNRMWCGSSLTKATMLPCIEACIDRGVKNIMTTIWGDDGTECDYYSALPSLLLYADKLYKPSVETDATFYESLVNVVCGCSAQQFDEGEVLDKLPRSICGTDQPSMTNCGKWLLWKDESLGLLAEELPVHSTLEAAEHYARATRVLSEYSIGDGRNSSRLSFPSAMCAVLARKLPLRRDVVNAYTEKDMMALRACVASIELLIKDIRALWQVHRSMWMRTYKIEGWECIEQRYGTLLLRMETMRDRITMFIENEVTSLPEYEARIECVFTHVQSKTVTVPQRGRDQDSAYTSQRSSQAQEGVVMCLPELPYNRCFTSSALT